MTDPDTSINVPWGFTTHLVPGDPRERQRSSTKEGETCPRAERSPSPSSTGRSVGSAQSYPNIDPSTGATLGDVARAGDKEIDQAVAAARRASRAWRATTPEQRSDLLSRLAGLIDGEVEALARLESEDSGKPLSQARNDARVCARYFRFYSHVIESYYGLSIPLRPDLHVYTRREPLGVTGHIVAWNYPMQLFGRAVAPAIAAGNCAVLKPADETPRTAVYLARLAAAAGLPPGVVNVVTGLGPEAGAALAAHPDVDHLSFVGSTEVGSLIAGAAARRVAPVTLELGGKSAHLIFADADVERAATTAANVILQNAGQTCSAGSRVLVDERVHGQVLQRIAERFGAVTIGPGITDPDLGPLVSRKQQDRVRGYVESAKGADIVYGGTVAEPDGISGGAYFNPTLIDGVDPAARIAQEEIFGPVITVTTFGSEEEAVALANGTDYALIGAVWTTDLGRAHRVAAQVDGGQIYVNTYGAGGRRGTALRRLPQVGLRAREGRRGARRLHRHQDHRRAVVTRGTTPRTPRCAPDGSAILSGARTQVRRSTNGAGPDRGRRHPHRGRRGDRDLPAVPGPRGGLLGAAGGRGHRRGRHLVLEPLPRVTLRLGELHLRVLLLRGAVQGVGVVRALRRAGGERAVLQPRGGQVRPAPPHPVQHQGHVGRLGRRSRRPGRSRRTTGTPPGRVTWWPRPACCLPRSIPSVPGRESLPRRVLPHRPVAEDSGGLQGQAGRGHRHRVERRAGHPGHRPRGRLADRVPAHAELGHPAQQPAGHPGGAGRAEGGLRGDPRHRRQVGVRVPAPALGQDAPSTTRPRSGRRSTSGSGSSAGSARSSATTGT